MVSVCDRRRHKRYHHKRYHHKQPQTHAYCCFVYTLVCVYTHNINNVTTYTHVYCLYTHLSVCIHTTPMSPSARMHIVCIHTCVRVYTQHSGRAKSFTHQRGPKGSHVPHGERDQIRQTVSYPRLLLFEREHTQLRVSRFGEMDDQHRQRWRGCE